MDWLISHDTRRFIIVHELFFPLLFVARLIGFTALEVLRPARTVIYRNVILYDLVVFAVYQALIFPAALRIDHWIAVRPHLPVGLLAMPLAVRVLCYLVVADFGHYWIHRLMHYKVFWRIHKWHHAPDYMYWLMGVRATVPQQVLVNLPYIFAYSFVDLSPWWMALAIGAGHAVQNDWMHLNVAWRSSWLEWLIVTPRYHHIHHSDQSEHYVTNLAALFTVWDRMFGTYVDPGALRRELSFGIDQKVPLIRLSLGV
jgi:sterol desaturase/sphingolipid hydroxylase (fatty acid hydroxylase superfamily)